jgi:uncharacterized protein YutD
METGVLHFNNVLGITFSISANKDSAYLEDLLVRYRAILENTKKIVGVGSNEPLKLAILTGFLLCDEIEEMKNQKVSENKESYETEKLLLDMLARIDKVIPHE